VTCIFTSDQIQGDSVLEPEVAISGCLSNYDSDLKTGSLFGCITYMCPRKSNWYYLFQHIIMNIFAVSCDLPSMGLDLKPESTFFFDYTILLII